MTSRIYFCPGTTEYGAQERGAYMLERDAQIAAFLSATGQPCGPEKSGMVLPIVPLPLVRREVDTLARTEAPPSGAAKVWANMKSRVYHCPGTRYYGATSNGTYMTERDAIASGYRAAGGRTCGT